MHIQYFKQNASVFHDKVLLKRLGYHSQQKFTQTLDEFIQSPSINAWLARGHYDLVANAKAFFAAVAQFAGFSREEIDRQLNQFEALQKEKAKFKDSFIFVNTHFTRANEPLFALACCEKQRRIQLHGKQRLWFKSRVELLEELSHSIVEHYQQNQGIIGVWGEIQDYHVHLNDEVIVFDSKGNVTVGRDRNC